MKSAKTGKYGINDDANMKNNEKAYNITLFP